jgi:hypothetical protein
MLLQTYLQERRKRLRQEFQQTSQRNHQPCKPRRDMQNPKAAEDERLQYVAQLDTVTNTFFRRCLYPAVFW